MAQQSGRKVVATNRKARHDYAIEDVLEAGLVLSGTEVKSLRQGRASLVDGFVSITRGEAWLEGGHIPEYTEGTWTNHAARRRRRFLRHREGFDRLDSRLRVKGYAVVPRKRFFLYGCERVDV